MDDETKVDLDEIGHAFLERLRVAGQMGELMAFGASQRLERFKSSARVQDQHERDKGRSTAVVERDRRSELVD